MNIKTISLDELKAQIGGKPRYSRWFELDQERINQFADVTEDWQYIHTDPKQAQNSPFESTIAHGFLTLSMLSAMSYDVEPELKGAEMGVNYGFSKVRFTSPVKAGQKVRAKFITRDVEEKTPTNILVKKGVNIEIEGQGRPAISAEWLVLLVLKGA